MLTDDERSAFLQSIARVRQRAGQALRQAQGADGADGALAFIAQLHRGLDTVAEQARTTGPQPACQAGCAHCCHLRVEATEPEVFHIAQHLRAQPATVRADAISALQRHVATAQASTTRQACSFLVDERCSIYPVRPAACRKAHSLSAKHCAEQSATIPQNLRLLVDAEALMAGTALAYRDQHLPASAHELNAAVLATLSDPTALHRWHQGDPAALVPTPAPAQDPHTHSAPPHP
ncbi:YkgJ family cysteine cluster protein [Acidovorax kalamii]|uniref:YkgJ family cysteine cluster protein n=1 Tax=Acidovorax kalamii TaxID=2004485 RepID=UPI002091118E|nr:YkgJ family cysteine cluster protein [Acidovorax kalamii]MCO5358500.1 YkgJ family cysteine cluster protein [Acidovorax kalamii]